MALAIQSICSEYFQASTITAVAASQGQEGMGVAVETERCRRGEHGAVGQPVRAKATGEIGSIL